MDSILSWSNWGLEVGWINHIGLREPYAGLSQFWAGLDEPGRGQRVSLSSEYPLSLYSEQPVLCPRALEGSRARPGLGLLLIPLTGQTSKAPRGSSQLLHTTL